MKEEEELTENLKINSSLGSGVLTIPFNLAMSGYLFGLGLMILFAFITTISYLMLIVVANHSHRF